MLPWVVRVSQGRCMCKCEGVGRHARMHCSIPWQGLHRLQATIQSMCVQHAAPCMRCARLPPGASCRLSCHDTSIVCR